MDDTKITPVHFLSDAPSGGAGADRWREHFGRTIFRLDIQPLSSDSGYRRRAALKILPGFAVAEVECAGADYRRTRELIDCDDVALVVSQTGGGIASQFGREVTFGPGDAVLMLSGEVGNVTFPPGSHFTSFRLPLAALKPVVADLDAIRAQRIPAGTEPLRMLLGYGRMLNGLELSTPALRHTLVTHLYDLTALTLGATRDAAEEAQGRGLRAARLRAIKTDIAKNLDGNLSVGMIALRHRVTPRTIQAMFETEGTTFTEYVQGQRLERARRKLADPRLSHEKISSIAYDSGFGDLSHFNLLFRRRFGLSPSEARKVVL